MDVIDLFAGAGGSSEGARQAGARVVWAANHWALAVRVHADNHPETQHECQDLMQADFSMLPRCDLVLASPACQGHSKASSAGGARGSLPKHDADRSTAWAVVSCLEHTRAPIAVIENVVELRTWALYPSWRDALARLGYTTHEHVVQCADLGVPQERERLFITASRTRAPLQLNLPRFDHIAARTIRETRATGWRPVSELPANARRRIGLAAERHGDAFVAHYVSDDRGHDLDTPLPTITTKHQFAWVRRDARWRLERRMFTSREYARAMGFPDAYRLTGAVSHDCRLVGNAVPPPVMREIVSAIMRS